MHNMLSDTSLTEAIDHSPLHHMIKYDSDGTLPDTSRRSEEIPMIKYNDFFLFFIIQSGTL